MAKLISAPVNSGLRIPVDLLLLWAYLALLIFDYRRAEEDVGNLVVVLGLAHLGLGLVMLMRVRKINRQSSNWMLPMVIFALVSAATGILRGHEIYQVLSSLVPLVIFIVAVLVISNLRGIAERQLIASLAVFALLSTAWKLGFGFLYTGHDIETIRYQIISGAVPLLFAYGVAGIFVERRRWTLIALGLSLLVVLISVTRTYLVVFIAAIFIAILAVPMTTLGKIASRVAMLVFLGILALVAFTFLLPESTDRWVVRLGSYNDFDFDLTYAARVAEATYQVQRLLADPLGLIFGFGQAAETRFAGHAADMVRSVLGTADDTGRNYGHIFYVGLIYVGGFIFGGAVIATFVVFLVKAIRRSRRSWRNMSVDARFLTIWGISSFGGYLAYGFFGGTWGDRSISFHFGVAMGIVIKIINDSKWRSHGLFR